MYRLKVLLELAWVGIRVLFDTGWEKVVDFTKIDKKGVDADEVIKRL